MQRFMALPLLAFVDLSWAVGAGVSHLRLENEKLRCAAVEAQGGLRHRTRLRQHSLGQDTVLTCSKGHTDETLKCRLYAYRCASLRTAC